MATCNGDSIVQIINRTECIGNSLVKINSNFSALDKATCELSGTITNYVASTLKVVDTTNINLSYNSDTATLGATLVGKVPNDNGGAGALTGMLRSTLGTVYKAVSGVDYVAPATLGLYATNDSLSAYVPKPLNPADKQVLTYNDASKIWEAKTLVFDTSGLGAINGILKGNGTTVSKAEPGIDYVAPGSLNDFITKPTDVSTNQVLTYNGVNWIARTPVAADTSNFITKPTDVSTNQVLTYNGVNWIARTPVVADTSNFITKPTEATDSQVLTYNGVNWIARTPVAADTSNFITKPTDVSTNQVLTYNGVNWIANDVPFTAATRTTKAGTTDALNPDAIGSVDIAGFKGYFLYKIITSCEAWVRIYTDNASRTADASRLITENPSPSAGVIAQAITTTGGLTAVMSPAVIGFNNESTPTTNIPISVTNKSSSNADVTVTLTLVQTES